MRVHKVRETISVKIDKSEIAKFPIHMIQGMVLFGPIWVSPYLMQYCAERGVTITYLSDYGKFLARVEGPVSGNILLRKQQYRISDNNKLSCEIAKGMVAAKIGNTRTILQRHLRNNSDDRDKQKIDGVIARLGRSQQRCRQEESLDTLRGIEGDAAELYFSCFNSLIKNRDEDFKFVNRNRRPPTDRINAMLSLIYTLITHDCRSALEGVGLDPQAGFLHRDRPGRPSLALDLAEEFRSYLGDRLVFGLINLKQVTKNDFKISASGAVVLNEEARKKLLSSWQSRKQEEIIHPFLNEKIKIGILFHVQALLLARHIRGDYEKYPAFICR